MASRALSARVLLVVLQLCLAVEHTRTSSTQWFRWPATRAFTHGDAGSGRAAGGGARASFGGPPTGSRGLPLCFGMMRPMSEHAHGSLGAITCLQLRAQLPAGGAAAPRLHAARLAAWGRRGEHRRSTGLGRARTVDGAAALVAQAQVPDDVGHGLNAREDDVWTAARDARGTPLWIEAVNGATPLQDEGDEADFQVLADEEFEYGWWAPSKASVLQVDQDDSRLPTVEMWEGDIDIRDWRDGEMESELGRLEMAVGEDRMPSLLQLNKAMHLCCKAVYKGLGQAGLAKGLRVLNLMWECGVAPNSRSFDLLLDAAIGSAAQGNKEALYVALTIVLNMCELGIAPRVILVNQLLKQVLKATGNVEEDFSLALKVMDAVSASGLPLDIYTYNSFVAATALQPQQGPHHSLRLMARMRRHKVKPDIVTYNAFLHTCAKSCHVHGYPKTFSKVLCSDSTLALY